MNSQIPASTSAAAPVNAGANDVGNPLDAGDAALEQALMGVLPGALKTSDTPKSSATDDPAAEPAPLQPGEPGEDSTKATPATEGEPEGEPEGADKNVLSQTGDTELDAALAALTPEMQQHVAELQTEIARQVVAGTLKSGQVPRFTELLRDRHEMAAALSESNRERDEALAKAEASTRPAAPVAMPETVARLKSLPEVKARGVELRGYIRSLERYLTQNPEGGEIGGKPVSAAELRETIWRHQDELDLLPERAEQIETQAAQTQRLQEISKVARQNHPWLNDAAHAETKTVRDFLKKNPGVDELTAAALVRGLKSLEAEVTARNGKTNGTKPTLTRPVGKVPLGKPHAGGGVATGRAVAPLQKFKAALPKAGEAVTEDHLESALANLPR